MGFHATFAVRFHLILMNFLSRRRGLFFLPAFLVFILLAEWGVPRLKALEPFGANAKGPSQTAPKAVDVAPVTLDPFAQSNTAAWILEPKAAGAPPFSLGQADSKDTLILNAGDFTPKLTTVRMMLPGDAAANGDAWAKSHATYVSFQVKSTKPAKLTFHLLLHGKTPGTYSCVFDAKPGDWQTVTLPYQNFGLKSLARVAGIGFRVVSAEKDTQVTIANLTVSGAAYSEDTFKARHVSISINGDWLFATEDNDEGIKGQWYAENFNDSGWKTLKSGTSWQEQGIQHHGYGWYRQKIVVPKEMTGAPLTITTTKTPGDDDFWFNGTRIGGWNGGYKYANQLTRVYTVPASLIHYGAPNTMATRIWGGQLGFDGDKSGLVNGPLVADLDPYYVSMRAPGGEELPADDFDLSDAQQGKPFEIVFRFPPEAVAAGAQVSYHITDFDGGDIASGKVPATASKDANAPSEAVVPIGRDAAQLVYLRGRIKANLMVEDASGNTAYSSMKTLDHLCFAKRDNTALPALPETTEDTPYGKLKLIDEIDCAKSIFDEEHPYTQSGFEHNQDRMPPGAAVDMQINEILGKKAREPIGGWFAYRIGRGGLKPHSTYLVRIEYPEDKPRYCPLEIQSGQTYMDIGWKNGVGADDPYDNWPLSHAWQWYDAIVPADDKTAGNGGAGSSKIENGFWIYFFDEVYPNKYNAMFSGGPAIARIKLYEIDPEKNAPAIRMPEGLPHRVMGFDWERQAEQDPFDMVKYAKLMGYTSISPIMIKWGDANYAEPLNGYNSVNVDSHGWWTQVEYDPATMSGQQIAAALPGTPSVNQRYLEATKKWGIDYIPRIEYGGSQDLPASAHAIDVDGSPMKPDRFGKWCANLLDPATWDDIKKLMDTEIKPFVKDNPQLKGVLWRIREDRMPVSYGKKDIELFSKETNTPLPPGGDAQAAAWAAGDVKTKYDDWWQGKREAFHAKLVALLQSYRPDLTLYYYNWDEDKFGLINCDTNGWNFIKTVVAPGPTGGRAAYEADRKQRASFTAADYISVMHSGNFGAAGHANRTDYAIRPELYKDVKGMQIFAPMNYLCYADKPEYTNYFQMPDGLAVSNVVSYDELSARSINPKYEGVMITPAGAPFSMAIELLAYFHGDARTLNYTPYTYGRGFADAHRRFAQAFLALPAIKGTVIDQGDGDLKVRTYDSNNGTYVGVAYKGYSGKSLTVKIPCDKAGATVENLVTGEKVPATSSGGSLQFNIGSGPMELNAFLIH